MVDQSLRANGKTGLIRDHGALDLQEEEDVRRSFAQRLEISLAFGDDDVCALEVILKCPTTVVQGRPWRIGAIVDHCCYPIQADSLRIGQRGIIEYGTAAHCDGGNSFSLPLNS